MSDESKRDFPHECRCEVCGRCIEDEIRAVIARDEKLMRGIVEAGSDTPETDAALHQFSTGSRFHFPSCSRKLEKERDGLQIQLDAWQSVFQTSQLSHAAARLEAAEKERDDARACLKEAMEEIRMVEHEPNYYRWYKAAGLTVGEKSG